MQKRCGCIGEEDDSKWVGDGNGIPLCRTCPRCHDGRMARFRREILLPYTQADIDEPVESTSEAPKTAGTCGAQTTDWCPSR